MSDLALLTAGQRDALNDLQRIEVQEAGLRIEGWSTDGERLDVTVGLDCSTLRSEQVEGGLRLRDREFVQIHVPAAFPLVPPWLSVGHKRFAEYENVMRGGGICVFRSVDTEWTPTDGMGVFVRDRVWGWMRRAVRGEAESQHGVFHSPLLHDLQRVSDAILYDTAEPETDDLWLGWVGIRPHAGSKYPQSIRTRDRWSLTRWCEQVRADYTGEVWGAGVLLPTRGGFYFPKTLGALLDVFEAGGLGRRRAVAHLGKVAHRQPLAFPLVIVVGTPLGSGFAGRHHLTTLCLTSEASQMVRRAGGTVKRDAAIDAVLDRAAGVDLRAFFGRDARAGHVERRDKASPMDWFAGKTVAFWGAGALGAPAAEYVVRAGAARVILRDNGFVHRGLLVRQPYTSADEEILKVDALRRRLRSIRPGVTVDVCSSDLRASGTDGEEWSGDVDLIVNATASAPVRVALDLGRATSGNQNVPVLSLGVDGQAERGFARLLVAGTTASTEEAERDAQIEASRRNDLTGYADAFFPTAATERREPFFPEPGCSDATFVGSAADLAALSSTMLNWAAAELASGTSTSARALLMCQPHVALRTNEPTVCRVESPARIQMHDDRRGYRVRMTSAAVDAVRDHIRHAAARNGEASETGGALWGRYDDAMNIVWVDDASAAPPDSVEAPDRFVCGVEGLHAETATRACASRDAVGFVGTWHTHPSCQPVPSARDHASMADVCTRSEPLPRRFLMMIVGSPHSDEPDFQPYVFSRDEYTQPLATQ